MKKKLLKVECVHSYKFCPPSEYVLKFKPKYYYVL